MADPYTSTGPEEAIPPVHEEAVQNVKDDIAVVKERDAYRRQPAAVIAGAGAILAIVAGLLIRRARR